MATEEIEAQRWRELAKRDYVRMDDGRLIKELRTCRTFSYPEVMDAAADRITDLRRQLDEARAECAADKLRGDYSSGLSGGGINIRGDRASIDKIRKALHEYETVMPARITRLQEEMAQREAAERALAEARTECERQRERAEKAEEWSRLRALDIITLGQEVGKAEQRADKWQAAAEGALDSLSRLKP